MQALKTRMRIASFVDEAPARESVSARIPVAPTSAVISQHPSSWRLAPWLFVAGACIFGLLTLSGELTVVQPVNDESVHFEMVRWAVAQIHQGNTLPLDGWFPYLSLGDAQFSHYQSLPHLITAYFSLIFGTASAVRWAGYLLFALFPLSVYAGSRLLGWSSWVAGGAALVTPLLVSVTGYGYESFSYTWLGNGLWSQEWGMFLLPLAWGLSWRAVNGQGRGRYASAALVLGLTVAMHFITGYFALLSLGVFVIVVWRGWASRIGRAAVVFGGAALIASWVVVPLLSGGAYFNLSEFNQNTFWLNSWGAPQVFGWLFTGQIFDAGRFPIVSLLVALGAIVCACRFRRDARSRTLLGLMALSLLLFCGRPTFGFILNLLPGSSDLLLHRYIMGVQLTGLLLAGVGLAWAGETARSLARNWEPRVRLVPVIAGLMSAAVLITLPAWLDRAAYAASDSASIAVQLESDQTDGAALNVLINDINARGGGRTYAGLPGNWGRAIRDRPGTHLSNTSPTPMSTRSVSCCARRRWYPTTKPISIRTTRADYQLYNVRYVLMPSRMQPPVAATLLASSGRHRLWLVPTTRLSSGCRYGRDRRPRIAPTWRHRCSRSSIQPSSLRGSWLLWLQRRNGCHAHAFRSAQTPHTSPGSSTDVLVETTDGYFAGDVSLNRTAAVVLKATYDPRWHVLVDGKEATPYMVVPGFVAVTVSPGQSFDRFPIRPLFALLGLARDRCVDPAPASRSHRGSGSAWVSVCVAGRAVICLRGKRNTGARL